MFGLWSAGSRLRRTYARCLVFTVREILHSTTRWWMRSRSVSSLGRLSHVRSHAEELGIDPSVFAKKRYHVHVPAGAVPRDGPSAGVTLTTALVTLLRDVPVQSDLVMTSEVTLQGRVRPIGGVKQKVLAAHRAGLTEVVLPERNGPDHEDDPEEVHSVMTSHLASTIADGLTPALRSDAEEVAQALSDVA
jgi:ATP-dependent Lon protease